MLLEYKEEEQAIVNLQLGGKHKGAFGHLTASFAIDDHVADPWTSMIKVRAQLAPRCSNSDKPLCCR